MTRSVTSSSSNPSSIKGTSNGHARLLTRTLLSVARNAFSYAPLRIVARVPITPIWRLGLAFDPARGPPAPPPLKRPVKIFINNSPRTGEDAVCPQKTTPSLFLRDTHPPPL